MKWPMRKKIYNFLWLLYLIHFIQEEKQAYLLEINSWDLFVKLNWMSWLKEVDEIKELL